MMPNGQTHPTEICSAMSVNTMLGQVCLDAGYTEPVTAYTFRRGVANNMEATASSKSTKEALGHKGDRVWHHYAAPTITVDAQNVAYNKPEDASHARFSHSIAVTRDVAAFKPSGSQMGIAGVVSKDGMLRARSDQSPRTDRATFRKALKLQHRKDREEYISRAGSMLAQGESELDSDVQERGDPEIVPSFQRPESSPVFKQMLKYNSLQVRVIETLRTAERASLGECVKPLMALANTKPFRPFYPDPVLPPKKDGDCPYCNQDISQRHWGRGRRAIHLLQCHQKNNPVRFCLQCAMFVHDKLWPDHQCIDLNERRKIFGVITWRKLVIGEGRCPYGGGQCCGRGPFMDSKALKTHIEGVQIKQQPEGAHSCPAEGCGLVAPSKNDLRLHFQKTHYIKMWLSAATISK
ncbi:uncharacterized protein M421DRAFT_271125 [Didymella exigua CBS 183.55]|uniref:Uncharacterized protein n=1 Tax=Didymella exigua CBS 183.55 TaxID=1150837 RepID=A0A6A5RBA2_9PLEO|nr:uncharacterized protein M421DRAFT_271125 [Didymella exigua CBS 183.55]KAF1924803.1 hypothetical protein M421DRAFT_271125 [Didymella exigua CBS 183.55]